MADLDNLLASLRRNRAIAEAAGHDERVAKLDERIAQLSAPKKVAKKAPAKKKAATPKAEATPRAEAPKVADAPEPDAPSVTDPED